jgi:hypothetical protein
MDRKATASDRKSNNTKRKRGQRHWTPEQRQLFRAWHNYYPTLAYTRNDPKTIYVAVDHAARMAGMNRSGFYNRYLLSGRLPYVVKSWWHAGKRRRKSLVLRSALLEMLTEEICRDAKLQYVRRHRTTMAALERQLEERRKAEANGRNRSPGSDDFEINPPTSRFSGRRPPDRD